MAAAHVDDGHLAEQVLQQDLDDEDVRDDDLQHRPDDSVVPHGGDRRPRPGSSSVMG